MPIRLSKNFVRRRSAANVLDPQDETPVPSFRVLDRPQAKDRHKSFDGGSALRRSALVRPNSSPEIPIEDVRPSSYGSSNRESGNTNLTSSTNNSSQRFSFSSTIPSSVDDHVHDSMPLKEQSHNSMPTNQPEISPVKSSPDEGRKSFSIKAAGRKLSFGPKSSRAQTTDAPRTRERALTASSYASTATPPKLDLGSKIDLGSGMNIAESDFADGFGQFLTNDPVPPVPPLPSRSESEPIISRQASQYSTHPHFQPNDSPYLTNIDENQRLINTPPVPPHRTGTINDNASEHSFQMGDDNQMIMDALYASNALEPQHNPPFSNRNLPDRSTPKSQAPSRYGAPPSSQPHLDSPYSFRQSPYAASDMSSPRMQGGIRQYDNGLNREITPQPGDREDEPLFDYPRSTIRRNGARTSRLSVGGKPKTASQHKVMTPAEFEKYKQEKELGLREDDVKSESSHDSDEYEDESDTERQKEAMKQRRKQEAHLAVYRQQMMKVTGEQPTELPSKSSRPAYLERSTASAPNILTNLSFDKPAEESGRTSEDEDDDVPLGVLQAHGFPRNGRPPTRISMANASSSTVPRTTSQMSSYPQPPGATRNDQTTGGGGNPNLPIFAKNLPQDPYVGASLVNPMNRESMNNSGGAQTQPSGGLPPGGLVGVIAGEERARALRRGSPNANGTYDRSSQQTQQQMPQHMMQGQMPMMQIGQPMTPGDQASMHLSNQMQQMMQMQMQWMQQMAQMQGMAGQMPQMPNMGMQPDGHLRSTSRQSSGSYMNQNRNGVGSQEGFSQSFSNLLGNTPMSGVSPPSMYGSPGPVQGYTPSIAPSERSNVGQPSRYRPVTPVGAKPELKSRASTMSHTTIQPFNEQAGRARSQSRAPMEGRAKSSDRLTVGSAGRIKALNKPKHGAGVSDDEDDEGWAELTKKKEARRDRWRANKAVSEAMPGEQEGGMEALYYEG